MRGAGCGEIGTPRCGGPDLSYCMMRFACHRPAASPPRGRVPPSPEALRRGAAGLGLISVPRATHTRSASRSAPHRDGGAVDVRLRAFAQGPLGKRELTVRCTLT